MPKNESSTAPTPHKNITTIGLFLYLRKIKKATANKPTLSQLMVANCIFPSGQKADIANDKPALAIKATTAGLKPFKTACMVSN